MSSSMPYYGQLRFLGLDPRTTVANHIFALNDRSFVDMLVSLADTRLPTFASRYATPSSWRVDSLSFAWTNLSIYDFPLFALIHMALRRPQSTLADMLLIVLAELAVVPLLLRLLWDLLFLFPPVSDLPTQRSGALRHPGLSTL